METRQKIDAKDICLIIKTCRRFGIKSFKLDGLELIFNDLLTTDTNIGAPSRESPILGNSDILGEVSGPAPESIMIPADIDAIEEMETMQLLIDDPSAHETLMIDRNLNQHRDFMNEETRISRSQ